MLTDAEIMAAVLAAFQEEQAEHCQGIAGLLLELEQNPATPERKDLIDRLFREAHSLKGGARAAGQLDVEQIAHGMEDLFSAVRQGQLALTPAVCDPIYAALEAIGAIMAQVAANEPVSVAASAEVMVNLAGALTAPAGPAGNGGNGHAPAGDLQTVDLAEAERAALPPAWDADGEAGAARAGDQPAHAGRLDALSVRIPVAALDTLLNETGELMAYTVRAQQRTRQAEELADIPGRWRRTARQVRPIATRLRALEETIQPTVHYLEGRQGFAATASSSNGRAGYVDRDISALAEAVLHADALIGDLERRLTAYIREAGEDQSRLATVTDRLHDQIRRTRMLPLTTLLNPLRLQVRDMARAAGKPVHVLVDDGAAEADRQVLEALREIVLHLLRNAVDHGIEAQAVRVAHDKPAEGRIAVFSRVSGDRLSLVIEDDGAGIDHAAIRQRALGMGLHAEADLAAMGDAEVLDLIFLPGFSTSATVNSLSGRGVGLDIVRTQLQRIQGHITIHSVPGRGTRFALSVPLSLTSAQGLLLQADQDQYVVPLDSVQHILAVQPADLFVVEGQSTITYQGRPTLIVRLADVLAGQATRPGAGSAQLGMAVVLGSGDRLVACMIDAVLSEQEIVIHRLPAPLRRVRYVSSATILPDGAVVPILDVVDVVRGALGIRHAGLAAPAPAAPRREYRVLVVDDSLTTRTLQKNILEAAGYRVTVAADGAEALVTLQALLAGDGCDVLLSDVDMPRLNGFDLTSRIRADAATEHLPVILVTSLDTAADRERGIASGADAYIVKRDFDQQVLLDTIKQLI